MGSEGTAPAFAYPVRVRFQDIDAAGIVFYARFFDWAHEAFEEWMRTRGTTIAELTSVRDVGMPLVHAEADYAGPARHDDRLVVRVADVELRPRSVQFTFSIEGDDGSPRATVKHVHACIDMARFRAREWPERLRTALSGA